jgi:alkyldihydroxyacetonephosphate synthase
MGDGRKSFWAWGYEERLPNDEARKMLAETLGRALGFKGLTPRPLPKLEDVRIPAPRIPAPPHLDGSASLLDRVTHTYGRSYRDIVRGFAGDFTPAPDWVAYPKDEAQIAKLLAYCSKEKIAVIPFGGGTSVVGGVEAVVGDGYRGVIALDLRNLDRVLEVDLTSRAARIQAGATGPRLEAQLAPHGVTLRHYPQSFEHSTLGGWIATRAGGHFATLYTHIDDLVESVRMVTPTGLFATRRLPASGAGPSPERLVLGSEGILGVITEAWVRVQARPRWRASANVRFAKLEDGVQAARAIAQAGLYPSNCRLLDAREAMLHGVSADGVTVLLLAFESADHPLDAWIDRALSLAKAAGGTCPDGTRLRDAGQGTEERTGAAEAERGDAAAWRQAFFDAPYLQSALITMGVIADTFETACTWDGFDALHRAVKDAVRGAMQDACGAGVISCRFTHVYPDGPAPYYTFLAPARPGEELAQWERIKRVASDALIANGATITHHHAVGRLHRPWHERERPEPFGRALQAAKRALDPAGILNPGVLVDP